MVGWNPRYIISVSGQSLIFFLSVFNFWQLLSRIYFTIWLTFKWLSYTCKNTIAINTFLIIIFEINKLHFPYVTLTIVFDISNKGVKFLWNNFTEAKMYSTRNIKTC